MATIVDSGETLLPPGSARQQAQGEGFVCSTSGSVFTTKEELAEHYKSDFHRYNLKRKVAGLPPVTREWFEARKAQLASVQQGGVAPNAQRVWFDPLTRKKFYSENTYQAHVRSKKYQDLVRKSGQAAPAPVISTRRADEEGEGSGSAGQQQAARAPAGPSGFKVVEPSGGLPLRTEEVDAQVAGAAPSKAAADAIMEDAEEEEEGSGWETASDDDAAAGEGDEEGEWEEWDVRHSLFDNHVSRSFEANLEYMYKHYGFYLPDAEYLKDPEGLVKYLGSKLRYGKVPLYTRGEDANAKQFRSVHAVQRHMVDTNQCRMAYDDNEEEYAEYYDYGSEDEEEEQGALITADDLADMAGAAAAYELVLPGAGGANVGKILGHREFSRYYRQRHRREEDRTSVLVNVVQAKYRSLGITLVSEQDSLAVKKAKVKGAMQMKWEGKRDLGRFMRENINRNLPKNVPY